MKPGRITRRNPDPELLVELEPRVEMGELIRPFVGHAIPDRAADSDVAHPGPDEGEGEASEPRVEHSPEPEATRLDASEELAEPALTRAAAERAAALAEREAALDVREASLGAEQDRLRALEQKLAERNESLERRAAELTEHEARLTEHEARLGRRIRRYAERSYADVEGMETEASV